MWRRADRTVTLPRPSLVTLAAFRRATETGDLQSLLAAALDTLAAAGTTLRPAQVNGYPALIL